MARLLLSTNTAWNLPNFRAGVIRALRADGYDILCAAPADAHVGAIEALGATFIDLPIDSQGTSPVRDAGLTLRYRKLMKAHRVDAYLSWTPKPNIYGAIAARSLGVPAIINVSGLGVAFDRPGLLQAVVSNLYRVANAGAAKVFFQNPDNLDAFRRRGLVGRTPVALLPGSGVDLERFRPAPWPRDDGPVVFLLMCRLLRQKGVAEYAAAARRLRAAGVNAEFRLAGMLDSHNPAAIGQAELEGWVAAGDITYVGALDDVGPALADADCVVLPSYYPEGTPRSLLEAAASARPIITTDTAGCRDVVIAPETGYLAPPRDVDGLADAMARFAALSPAQRQQMGAASRRLCEARFDERFVTDAYLAAVREVLAATPG